MTRSKLIHMRLSVHKALTDQYVCNQMMPDDASKNAFAVVRAMKPAALLRYYETGR